MPEDESSDKIESITIKIPPGQTVQSFELNWIEAQFKLKKK